MRQGRENPLALPSADHHDDRVMHPGQVRVPPSALSDTIGAQFPALAGPVTALTSAGTVVAPYRVGETLLARLPLVPVASAAETTQIHEAGRHADVLRGHLPVDLPRLTAVGLPFDGYPGVWSLWSWVEGTSLDRLLEAGGLGVEPDALATDLALLLRAQRALPTQGAGWSRNGRGGRPLSDSESIRSSLRMSAHLIDIRAATRVWERALAAPGHTGAPVSIHGDPMPGNLVIRGGRLAGLIDIGEPVIGDPAADLQPAWEIFEEPQRRVFREAMGLDEAAWERGRGWAFQMAISGLPYYERSNPSFARLARRTLDRLIATTPH